MFIRTTLLSLSLLLRMAIAAENVEYDHYTTQVVVIPTTEFVIIPTTQVVVIPTAAPLPVTTQLVEINPTGIILPLTTQPVHPTEVPRRQIPRGPIFRPPRGPSVF
jgi:hypothetical protein